VIGADPAFVVAEYHVERPVQTILNAARAAALFSAPLHPNTKGLLRAIPRIDQDIRRLSDIPGSILDSVRSGTATPAE
jgi:ABC-type dipeptide/oligopeptide/nickel transport system ATPase component